MSPPLVDVPLLVVEFSLFDSLLIIELPLFVLLFSDSPHANKRIENINSSDTPPPPEFLINNCCFYLSFSFLFLHESSLFALNWCRDITTAGGYSSGEGMSMKKTRFHFVFCAQRHLIVFVLQCTAFQRPLQRSAFFLIFFLIIFDL